MQDDEPLSPAASTQCQGYAALAAFVLLVALLYSLYIWRSRKIPQDEPAYWDPAGSRHFSLGSIGGQPAPRLDDETLNQLADSMGYFQSQQRGKALDVPASIEATLRQGVGAGGGGGGVLKLVLAQEGKPQPEGAAGPLQAERLTAEVVRGPVPGVAGSHVDGWAAGV